MTFMSNVADDWNDQECNEKYSTASTAEAATGKKRRLNPMPDDLNSSLDWPVHLLG